MTTRPPIALDRIESLHLGGGIRHLHGTDPALRLTHTGHHMIGQMYAQLFHQARPRASWPLALWHGGGMSGVCWENTPDGQTGWLDYFLRQGYSVALCDAFERGRSSLPPQPEGFGSAPEYRCLDAIWHHFRFGPPLQEPSDFPHSGLRTAAYPGQQFPVEHLAQFGRQFVPRFTDSDEPTIAAYAAFLAHIARCAIVGHSQGAMFALQAALSQPAHVAAVVALEPPVDTASLDKLYASPAQALPPHLFIFGDFIHDCSATWELYLDNSLRYVEELQRRGVDVQLIELPQRGLHGNSHMLQMDANQQDIAALVGDWLRQHESSL